MTLNEQQFKAFRSNDTAFADPSRVSDEHVHFTAQLGPREVPAATIQYSPNVEVADGSSYLLQENNTPYGVQGSLLAPPQRAELDLFAVRPSLQGRGLGALVSNAAIEYHQDRVANHRSYPRLSSHLSEDSAGMASKMTGQEIPSTWDPRDEGYGPPRASLQAAKDEWATEMVDDAMSYSIEQPTTTSLKQKAAAASPPPPQTPAPPEGEQLTLFKPPKPNLDAVAKRYR